MKRKLLLAVVLTLATSAAALPAQDAGPAMVAQCAEVQKTKFRPLKNESNAVYSQFSTRSTVYRSVIRWLKEDASSAEAKRLAEIAELENRLKSLKGVADLTSGDAVKPANVKTTIENANVKIEDLGDDRAVVLRPLERKRSALQREYKDAEKKLEPIMEGLFKDSGSVDLTKDLKRSYASFSYSSAETGGQYKRGEKNSSVCSLRVYLVHDKKAKPDAKKVGNKYPIVSQSNYQLEILVGPALVTLYTSDAKLKSNDAKAKVIMDLVDIKKLESLLSAK